MPLQAGHPPGEPEQRRPRVGELAGAPGVGALRQPHAAELDAQRGPAGLPGRPGDPVGGVVVHRPPEERVGVEHQRRKARILGRFEEPLQAASGSGQVDVHDAVCGQ